MKDDGDLGPNGCNLLKTFLNHPNDRVMLVAEGESGVLGAVGVQRGEKLGAAAQQDEKEVTIWRMSVCQSARRRGVGLALMEAAQDHARNQWGCTKMKLVTANPVAASFYVNKIGMDPPNWKTFYTWYTKNL
jgi:GNAT superfamily N-acetyltransferase